MPPAGGLGCKTAEGRILEKPMAVKFDDKHISLFGDTVSYDPNYFAVAAEYGGTDYSAIVKFVLRQWAEALIKANAEEATLYLPIGIYDQCVERFAAAVSRNRVILRHVSVGIGEYSLDLRDLHGFIRSGPEVTAVRTKDFGAYDRAALIRALLEAELATI